MAYEAKVDAPISNGTVAKQEIDWTAYAEHYDDLCFANPAYLSNLKELTERLPLWNLPKDARVCEVGAGTGSFLSEAAKLLPEGSFTHIDFDPGMNARALAKYSRLGINVDVVEADVCDLHYPDGAFDLLICVNSVYSMAEHDAVLHKLSRWLSKSGKLFIIDFGRKVEVLDWALFILRNRVKEKGLRNTIAWYRDHAELLRQNRKGANAQSSGQYWLHSPDQFREALASAGWHVLESKTCYRDCCDLAVCVTQP